MVSAYWNGAATYYRGVCKAMHARGHQIVFVEPDIYDRQAHRDLLEDPPYAEVRVCKDWDDLSRELSQAEDADVIAKCSGVGAWDLELARGVLGMKSPKNLAVFWDVDAPETLRSCTGQPVDKKNGFRALVPYFDLILLYGGGPPAQQGYAALGARAAYPIYNAVDPDEYYPVPSQAECSADLLFIGHRLPDREERVRRLFVRAAELAPEQRFVLGGAGWDGLPLPSNVRWIDHVPTADHRSWNSSARFVLNINREAMAAVGYSPPTRVFEAAGCACCVITDEWPGLAQFFEPGKEILVANSAERIVSHLRAMPAQAPSIGQAARKRVLRDHTYDMRAALLERHLFQALERINSSPAVRRESCLQPTRLSPSLGWES
ncbi:MAG TPA: glycosyltransferase [Chloroflexota bacterium]|nr:glycosyltransferase [Chloroflexota bacterium]